jgi:hypothetical protein
MTETATELMNSLNPRETSANQHAEQGVLMAKVGGENSIQNLGTLKKELKGILNESKRAS